MNDVNVIIIFPSPSLSCHTTISYQTLPIRLLPSSFCFPFPRLRAWLIGSLAAGSKLFLLSDLYSTLIITYFLIPPRPRPPPAIHSPFQPPFRPPVLQLLPFQQHLLTSSPSSLTPSLPNTETRGTQLGPAIGPTSTHASCGLTCGLYVAYSSHSASPNLYLSPHETLSAVVQNRHISAGPLPSCCCC